MMATLCSFSLMAFLSVVIWDCDDASARWLCVRVMFSGTCWATDGCVPTSSVLGDRRVVWVLGERRGLHSHPDVQRERLQDRLHLGTVLGSPEAHRTRLGRLGRWRPEPEQVSLL